MKKSKAIRLAGFVGALCASGALLGTSISSTGAWFTDSANGNLTASSGHLKLTGVSNTSVNFANLMPGEDRTQNIPYTVDVSGGGVDIWLVFDKTTAAYGAFTGSNGVNYGGHTSGGMGRYGHFQVGNDGNVAFRSHNLQLANPGPNCADGTVPGADGRGGSDATGSATAECGVPDAIKLVSNVGNGYSGNVNVTFGLSGKQTQQNQQDDPNVPFQIVATQTGHGPTDTNF